MTIMTLDKWWNKTVNKEDNVEMEEEEAKEQEQTNKNQEKTTGNKKQCGKWNDSVENGTTAFLNSQ